MNLSRRQLLCSALAFSAAPSLSFANNNFISVGSFGLQGERTQIQVPRNPSRILVNDYCVLDTLQSWDLTDRVVACVNPKAISYLKPVNPRIEMLEQGLKSPHFSIIDKLKPQITFVSARLSRHLPELQSHGPVLMLAPDYQYGALRSYEDNLLSLAQIFDRMDSARKNIRQVQSRIQRIQDNSQGKTCAILMINNGRLLLLPPKGRCSLITEELGFKNIIAPRANTAKKKSTTSLTDEQRQSLNAQSIEQLNTLQPDHIFVLNKDLAVSKEQPSTLSQLITQSWESLKAVQTHRVHALTHQAWYLGEGGIQSMDFMLKDIELALK